MITEQGAPSPFALPQQRHESEEQTVSLTAKEVQQTIKEGTITVEMLEAEIARINGWEIRYREIDQDKIQLETHTRFFGRFGKLEHNTEMTAADNVAVRLIVFQALEYHASRDVEEALGMEGDSLGKDHFFEPLAG